MKDSWAAEGACGEGERRAIFNCHFSLLILLSSKWSERSSRTWQAAIENYLCPKLLFCWVRLVLEKVRRRACFKSVLIFHKFQPATYFAPWRSPRPRLLKR